MYELNIGSVNKEIPSLLSFISSTKCLANILKCMMEQEGKYWNVKRIQGQVDWLLLSNDFLYGLMSIYYVTLAPRGSFPRGWKVLNM